MRFTFIEVVIVVAVASFIFPPIAHVLSFAVPLALFIPEEPRD